MVDARDVAMVAARHLLRRDTASEPDALIQSDVLARGVYPMPCQRRYWMSWGQQRCRVNLPPLYGVRC